MVFTFDDPPMPTGDGNNGEEKKEEGVKEAEASTQ